MSSLFDDLLGALVGALFPARCPGCGRRGEPLCGACRGQLHAAPGAPLPIDVEWLTTCFAYEGVAREVIARAKYRGERAALAELARELGDRVAYAPATIDVVTWVPASRTRLRRSGIDHAAIVARVCARRLDVAARACLVRDDDAPQTARSIHDRRAGPKVRASVDVTDLTVLLVDDVTTTGATLAAGARALRAGGARAVLAATLARTPAPGEAVGMRPYTSRTTPG